MQFIADLHIHSHFSLATSKQLTPEHLLHWAAIKGIQVVGTGDCVHPGWLLELKEKLEPAGNGLYRLKKEYLLPETKELFGSSPEVYFLLTGEISSIYKKRERVRKVHNVTFFPDFESVESIQAKLDRIGNIRSDGRPILGLDSRHLLEMVLESSPSSFLVPAHIWTPWFSVLGSRSGFDSIEECFEDLTSHIFAVETGLSSDPPMNRACSFLDRFALISNSDAHSPEKLGREANLFDTDISYAAMYRALKEASLRRGEDSSDRKGFLGTIEFFPEEGKYHYDGHRSCNLRWDPLETVRHGGICPVCGKPVTVGVMYRVAELADRSPDDPALQRDLFYSITPLPEILAETMNQKSSSSAKVKREYLRLVRELGSEFRILLNAPPEEIREKGGELLGQAIHNLRTGKVSIEEGYDGEFGRIHMFQEGERSHLTASLLFPSSMEEGSREKGPGGEDRPRSVPSHGPSGEYGSIRFNIGEFKQLYEVYKLNGIATAPEEQAGMTDSASRSGTTGGEEGIQPLFTPEQLEAIEHTGGPCMVIAGPGSGKTRILTERIAHLIVSREVDANSILAVTFSNRAAGEIRERLKASSAPPLADAPGPEAPSPPPSPVRPTATPAFTENVSVLTFHALGLSILKEHHREFGLDESFSILDEEEQNEIFKRLAEEGREGSRERKRCLKSIGDFKMGLLEQPVCPELFEEYERELRNSRGVDLDDLIHLPVRLLRKYPEIREDYRHRYSHILVDEYQDINPIQYELLRLLSGEGSPDLFVIGDPDQAIYGFRGSDASLGERLAIDYPSLKRILLKRSFRCPDPVLRAAGQVLLKREILSGKSETRKITIHYSATDNSEADWIASEIERMVGGVRSFSRDSGMSDGEVAEGIESFSDFAVLCRTQALFPPLMQAFENHGIAYQIVGSRPFFEKPPSGQALHLLKKIYYRSEILPSDPVAAKIGPELDRIRRMVEEKEILSSVLKELFFAMEGKEGGGRKESREREGDADRSRGSAGQEGYDRERLIRLAATFDNRYPEFFRHLSLRKGDDDFKIRAEAVSLMTIHASKGLEFPCVFLPGCEAKILPFEMFGKKDGKELAEEERLFYVGLTRTKRYLFLSYAAKRTLMGRTFPSSKSPLLDRLQKELYEITERAPLRDQREEGQLFLL